MILDIAVNDIDEDVAKFNDVGQRKDSLAWWSS